MFAQRLDFAMKVTNTSAAALGRAVSLDPSHVSRLRNGTRSLPKNPEFLSPMAAFLRERAESEYQRAALAEAVGITKWPADEAHASLMLEHWLSGAAERQGVISTIVDSFSHSQKAVAPESGRRPKTALPPMKSRYYGDAGKQEAVLQFFTLVLKHPRPQTLLLLSEENMEWLYRDPMFTAQWAELFRQVLAAGNRVRIVHSLKRDLTELFEAVAKWMPIYLTGAIEPHYLPRLRDGICRRTLFIAPDTCAVSSFSIGEETDEMLNELFIEQEPIHALEREFENYFALCKPLMRISPQGDAEGLWESLHDLLSAGGDALCMAGSPTLATMPEDVIASLQERASGAPIAESTRSARMFVRQLAKKARVTLVVPRSPAWALPDQNARDLEIPCAGYFGCSGMLYQDDEMAAHIRAADRFVSESRGLRIVRASKVPANLLVIARENVGTVMIKTDAPCISFAFTEPTMTNAFREYLASIAGI